MGPFGTTFGVKLSAAAVVLALLSSNLELGRVAIQFHLPTVISELTRQINSILLDESKTHAPDEGYGQMIGEDTLRSPVELLEHALMLLVNQFAQ